MSWRQKQLKFRLYWAGTVWLRQNWQLAQLFTDFNKMSRIVLGRGNMRKTHCLLAPMQIVLVSFGYYLLNHMFLLFNNFIPLMWKCYWHFSPKLATEVKHFFVEVMATWSRGFLENIETLPRSLLILFWFYDIGISSGGVCVCFMVYSSMHKTGGKVMKNNVSKGNEKFQNGRKRLARLTKTNKNILFFT